MTFNRHPATSGAAPPPRPPRRGPPRRTPASVRPRSPSRDVVVRAHAGVECPPAPPDTVAAHRPPAASVPRSDTSPFEHIAGSDDASVAGLEGAKTWASK